MIHIKRFIDKISSMESKQNKDVVLPMQEARGLRDEVAKLLSDLYERNLEKDKTEEVLKVEITGGKCK
jgi:hypothetical protein